jgi:hypothetical protein
LEGCDFRRTLKKAQEPSANTATLAVSSFATCDDGDLTANDEETPLEFAEPHSGDGADDSMRAGADGDLVSSAALFLIER